MLDAASRRQIPRPDPFALLNAEQRAAVEHGADAAALLVIAGAGSGKTMTLAARVAHLVRLGADPQRLLLLTFSRRAAQEMERRAGTLVQRALGLSHAPSLPWAGTFHGVGARLLREHAPTIGLPADFTIHDRTDAEDLMGWTRQQQGLAAAKRRFPQKDTCLAIYSRAVNSQAPLGDVLQHHFPWCAAWEAELKALFGAYVQAKQQQHALDYDDLLLHWWQLMTADAALARAVAARFDHVLVDEYQDTNRLQAAILLALKPDGRGLTVVGDDAQAIYSFRAAEPRNMLDFPRDFAEPPARIVTLARSYRATQPLLDASNAVIALAAERFAKDLWTDRAAAQTRPQLVAVEDELAQARWVADRLLALREGGLALKRQATLFRTAHHSTALELELTRRDIPFVKFGGLKFLETAHVKDLLALLRWAENPRSRLAGFRVAQLVPGIGPATVRRLLDTMEAAPDPAAALLAFAPPPAAARNWRAFADAYGALRAGAHGWPDEVGAATRWLSPQIERLHGDDAAMRLADLAQLARIAAGYASRERFLTELTLDPPAATSDEAGPPGLDEDYTILSTIHSAKGQEWSAVSVLNVVDGCIPSDMATGNAAEIEEERRLLYVAMTRARDHLHLLVPQRFHVGQQAAFGDRHVYAALSRFIPPELAARPFQLVGASSPAPATCCPPRAAVGAAIDLQARVRAMWS